METDNVTAEMCRLRNMIAAEEEKRSRYRWTIYHSRILIYLFFSKINLYKIFFVGGRIFAGSTIIYL